MIYWILQSQFRILASSLKRTNAPVQVFLVVFVLAMLTSVPSVAAIAPTAIELDMTATWVRENFLSTTRVPPFSFKYGGTSSASLLSSWPRQLTSLNLDPNRTQHTIIWTHQQSGLEVRCVVIEYRDHPVCEWTVYLKNTGLVNTTQLQDILALDMSLTRTNRFEYILHGIKGDSTTADSYQPYDQTLGLGTTRLFSPPSISGKSSDGPDGWPYFNLQLPGGGIIMAVGWPGQWATSFTRVGTKGLTVRSGQQLTNLYLKPGEQVRTPLMALLFWRGDDVNRSQNLWRHWYIDHVIPHFNGIPQQPTKQIQVAGNDAAYVAYFINNTGITPDICWRDAGSDSSSTWYPSSIGPYTGTLAWLNTGTWDPEPTKFPSGFKPFSDYVHSRGSSFLLWFEPERVGNPLSFLGTHPQWLLAGTPTTVGDILNLGYPDAYNWLVNHIDGMLKTHGIDWYREDMNGNGPLPAWRNADAANRQGITENFYVQGHLNFWDELRNRNPSLHIDSCASGGRRNDLETMRRAVPLLRSDFQFPSMTGVVEGNQCHTYGLSYWLPFQGSGVYSYDAYSFRSFYMSSFGMGGLDGSNQAAQIQAYTECSQIAPAMLFGDYYPLTPYSLASDVWIAWQFDRPENGTGCVQAFRRQNSLYSSQTYKLKGLDPVKTYEVRNFDVPGTQNISGQSLMDPGLTIQISSARGSAVIYYKPVTSQSSSVERNPYRPPQR